MDTIIFRVTLNIDQLKERKTLFECLKMGNDVRSAKIRFDFAFHFLVYSKITQKVMQ